MSIPDKAGIRFINQIKLGINDLGWAQEEVLRRMFKRDLWMKTGRRGLIIPRTPGGDLTTAWSVDGDQATGKLRIRTGVFSAPWNPPQYPEGEDSCAAIDSNGEYFEHVEDQIGTSDPWHIQVPDDSTWYTLVARKLQTHRERGYITVTTGSTTITGVNTEFTRWLAYTDDGVGRGAKIRIPSDVEVPRLFNRGGSSVGNESTYEVDEVISDTQIVLRTPVLGTNEAGLHYFIEGDFAGTAPVAPAGDVHWYDRAEFELVARTIVPAAGDCIIADVMYNSATGDPDLQVIDRRFSNVWMPAQVRPPGIPILAPITVTTQANEEALELQIDDVYASYGTGIRNMDAAPMKGGWLVAVDADTDIRAAWYERESSTVNYVFDDPNGVTSVIDATVGSTQPALVQVPQPDEDGVTPATPTHICVYIRAGIVRMRTTVDRGDTWSAESNIWDPTTVDPTDEVNDPHLILLQCGRIVLLGTYTDNGGGGQTSIRFVTSDNLGTTWSTNGGAGTTWALDGGAADYSAPSIFQDEYGLIHTAWVEEGVTKRIWYESSTSPYTLTRTGGGTTPLGASEPMVSSNTDPQETTTAIWADPHGAVNILTHEDLVRKAIWSYVFSTVSTKADGSTLEYAGTMHHLFHYVSGVAAFVTRDVCHRLKQANGQLVLFFVDVDTNDARMIQLGVSHTPTHLGYRYA